MKLTQTLLIITLIIFLVGCTKQAQTTLPPVPKASGGQTPSQTQPSQTTSGSGNIDLAFDSKLSVSAEDFTVNNKIDIAARILNNGTSASGDFTVAIYANDDKIHEEQLSLSAGGKKVIEYFWQPPSAGDYKIKMVLDPDKKVAETNELNNALEVPLPPITS